MSTPGQSEELIVADDDVLNWWQAVANRLWPVTTDCRSLPSPLYWHYIVLHSFLLPLTVIHRQSSQVDRHSLFRLMSQHTSYSDAYYLSGYPPPPQTKFSQMDYKSSSDDLVDITPYGKGTQHQTFAIETPALGSPHYPPSILTQHQHQKQSYSSEHSGKSTDEGIHPSAPRTVPLNTSKEVDSRTFWQKVRWFYIWTPSLFWQLVLSTKILPESLACRLYVITVLVQTSIDIAIEGDLFVRFHKGDADPSNPDKMPAYLSIFALAQ